MKTTRIVAGVLLILAAVLILLDGAGVIPAFTGAVGVLSFWRLSLAVLLVSFAVHQIIGRSFGFIISLALTFMLLETNIATALNKANTNLINNWLLLGCAVLLAVGCSLVFSGKGSVKNKNHVTVNRFRELKKFIDAADFKQELVKNRWGAVVLHFENTTAYTGGGVLQVENYMGSITVVVPNAWNVVCDVNGVANVVETAGNGMASGPVLTVKGKSNFAAIEIKYI